MNTAHFFKRAIGATLVAGALTWSSPAAWAAPKVGTTTVGAQAPNPVTAGSPATYTVTVNRGSGGGSSGAFQADMSISNALPPGYRGDGRCSCRIATTAFVKFGTALGNWRSRAEMLVRISDGGRRTVLDVHSLAAGGVAEAVVSKIVTVMVKLPAVVALTLTWNY